MISSKVVVALLATLISGTIATAQEFPTKAVELVLPYGAGGSHDLTARAVASVAQQYLGQPLLVVLKPGGGGAVGSQQVIRAKPDGYTLAFGGTGPNTVFAMVQKIPIGPDQFTPVARINHSPTIFAVRAANRWLSLPSMPIPRHGLAGAVIGNRLHLVSGDVQSAGIADMHLHADSHDAFEFAER